MRDRVVLCALAVGALLALIGWLVAGPWVALAVALIAIGVASFAYRVEAPRIDVDHPEGWPSRTQETVTRRGDQ